MVKTHIPKKRGRGRPLEKVYKSNALVNEARYKLSLKEQRFIMFAISKIRKDDKNREYTFSVNDFAKALKWNSHNTYKNLRILVKSLMNRSLSFFPDEDTEVWIHWFDKVVYKRYKATISFTFSNELTPHLFNLKEKFTAFKLEPVLKFGSIYSIRIYELLKEAQWQGGKEISLDDLRQLLGLSDKYPMYKDFRRNVLMVAKQELAQKSDIRFTYEPIKSGKRVVAVFLKCNKKSK